MNRSKGDEEVDTLAMSGEELLTPRMELLHDLKCATTGEGQPSTLGSQVFPVGDPAQDLLSLFTNACVKHSYECDKR